MATTTHGGKRTPTPATAVKILAPVKDVPTKSSTGRTVYDLILRRLNRMENGHWLPVKTATSKTAHAIASNLLYATNIKARVGYNVEARVRGTTVYIRREQ